MRMASPCLVPLRNIATSGTGRLEAVAFMTVEAMVVEVNVWIIPVCLTIRADSEASGVDLYMMQDGLWGL